MSQTLSQMIARARNAVDEVSRADPASRLVLGGGLAVSSEAGLAVEGSSR